MFFCPLGFAQQNFFNVPSSEITEKNKVFVQEQINLYSQSYSSNTTFCLGLGKGFELGANLLGITYNKRYHAFVRNNLYEKPIFPTLGLNAQKSIEAGEHYTMALGFQTLSNERWHELEFYSYFNQRLKYDRLKLIFGIYAANSNYLGRAEGRRIFPEGLGFQSGLEYELIHEKLAFQADYISGNHALGNLIAGGAYKLNSHHILSLGFQLPNHSGASSRGIVFEYTFVQ